jgi:D-serine deaminase-like pyridoxal phosphate-dependent protein
LKTSRLFITFLLTQDELLAAFKDMSFSDLRTPAAIIDRNAFARNCQAMKDRVEHFGAIFRAHVKSHKVSQLLESKSKN